MREVTIGSHVRKLASGRNVHVNAHKRLRGDPQPLRISSKGYRFPTTPTEEDVYNAILCFWRDYGIGPTIIQIEEVLGWRGRANIVKYLDALESRGLIGRPLGPKAARGITIPQVSEVIKKLLAHVNMERNNTLGLDKQTT